MKDCVLISFLSALAFTPGVSAEAADDINLMVSVNDDDKQQCLECKLFCFLRYWVTGVEYLFLLTALLVNEQWQSRWVKLRLIFRRLQC